MEPCDDRQNNKFVYDQRTRQIKIASDPTKCLDIFHNKNANGAKLTEYRCHNGSNQKWTIEMERKNNVKMGTVNIIEVDKC